MGRRKSKCSSWRLEYLKSIILYFILAITGLSAVLKPFQISIIMDSIDAQLHYTAPMLGRNQTTAANREDEDRRPLLNDAEEGEGTELFSTDDHGQLAETARTDVGQRGGPALTSPTASREVGKILF
jgi:hypothetical protein